MLSFRSEAKESASSFVILLTMSRREYDFFVYIAASRSRQLYIGVTSGLRRRMAQHREHRPQAYTAHYNIDRLVYYEVFQYVTGAIAREKKLKDWNRGKKIGLIERINPTWEGLSTRWEPWPNQKQIPPLRCGMTANNTLSVCHSVAKRRDLLSPCMPTAQLPAPSEDRPSR
jgi:putative endonuclease